MRRRSKHKPMAVQRHHDRVAELGCLVCGGLAEVHHVRGFADKPGSIPKDEWLVVPLCPAHHRYISPGGERISVHDLGHQGFFQEHGIDLYSEAMRLAEDTQRRAA